MRVLVILGALIFLATPAHAALDPESKIPYQLCVVVRFAEHPHFTEHFRREFKRELLGNLQASLGNLGSVEVLDLASVTKDDWPVLWKLVEEHGLEALDGFHDVGGGKTHFLRLDFVDGQYDLQARQHDGTSGFVTPLIRKARTHDRGYVPRLAGITIGKDFGLVATLNPAGAGERLFLKAKGGELEPIDNWVKKGEVFAVVAIERRRPPLPQYAKGTLKSVTLRMGNRVDGVLLVVTGEPEKGMIPCQMFHRLKEMLPSGVLGFRCVKLGTTAGPLRLQLVDVAGIPQKAAALQVYASAVDFPQTERESEQAILRDGVFVSRQPFAHVAFVRVVLGNRRIARIPVELLDDRVQSRSIWLDPAAEQRDRLDAERRGLLTRLTDGRLIQVRCFQEITALEQAGKKSDALDRGQSVLKLLDAAAVELQEEIDKLQASAAQVLAKADGFAADCGQQLQILRGKQKELRNHLDELRESIAEDNNPMVLAKRKRVQDLVLAAKLLADQAEYDKALVKYEEALAAAADEPEARQRINAAYQALKKAWDLKPGDAAHAAARKFILETWPKLANLKDVRDRLVAARQAFERCKAVGDRLAVNKMHLASFEIATKFSDELKKLVDAAMEDEEKKTLEIYQKVSEDLQKLLKDVQDYLLAGAKP